MVIKPGALGDTLLLAPALRALRAVRPAMPVTVVGAMPQAALLPLLGVADRACSFDRFALYEPRGRGAELLAGATVLAMLSPPQGVGIDPLRSRGARRTLWRPSRPGSGQGHAARYLHRVLQELYPDIAPLSRRPFPLPAGTRVPGDPPPPYAVLAPGAGSAAKRLPLERFLALAEALSARGLQPLFLLGEVERDSGLERLIPAHCRRVLCPSPEALAGLLGGAREVYANDSGPAHLAGLLGAATTVFFGPTDPRTWRPWGPRIRVVRF